MRKYLAVVKKDLKLALHRRLDLIVLIIMPVAIALIAGKSAGRTPSDGGGFVEEARRAALGGYGGIFARVATIFVLFGFMGGAFSLFYERKRGIIQRLLIAHLNYRHILLGKATAMFLICLAQSVIIFVVFAVLFGVSVRSSIAGFTISLVCLSAAASSMAILFSGLCRTEQSLHALPVMTVLGMSALGGSIMSLDSLPSWAQNLSYITVNRWAIDAIENSMWKGGGWLLDNIVLLFMALAMSCAGMLLWKRLGDH